MANLTDNKGNTKAELGAKLITQDVVLKSGVQMWQGGALFRNPADSGLLVTDPATGVMLDAYGVAATNQLGDGLRAGVLGVGCYEFDNSATSGETIPAYFPLGWPVYAKDNQTVSMHNIGSTKPRLGYFGGFAKSGKPLVWVGFCPYPRDVFAVPFAYGHADLTDADTSQDFTLYTLPGPARVMCPPVIDSLTVFTGGGAGAVTLAIGADSDPDALGDEKSIFTGGAAGAMTAGVLGYSGALLAAGTVIKAQFVTDATLLGLTAGAVAGALLLRPGSA